MTLPPVEGVRFATIAAGVRYAGRTDVMLALFDAPTRETCAASRSRTNTPTSALVTLNDPAYIEAAGALAGRMIAEGGATAEP